ncbi:TraR/DksA C4-type zinc finger protein [Acinetobacter bereziniae]|uniref:TraR/DksA C4-type zinc finger protein n=1 Tax=Acinetobacter bereziniae TaxID=106648 RepID=UPI00300A7A28
MVDLVDLAEEFQAMNLQEKIEARAQFQGVSLYECAECGEEIPEQRRAIGGVTLCIKCQTDHEAKQKHYR